MFGGRKEKDLGGDRIYPKQHGEESRARPNLILSIFSLLGKITSLSDMWAASFSLNPLT